MIILKVDINSQPEVLFYLLIISIYSIFKQFLILCYSLLVLVITLMEYYLPKFGTLLQNEKNRCNLIRHTNQYFP